MSLLLITVAGEKEASSMTLMELGSFMVYFFHWGLMWKPQDTTLLALPDDELEILGRPDVAANKMLDAIGMH